MNIDIHQEDDRLVYRDYRYNVQILFERHGKCTFFETKVLSEHFKTVTR